MTSFMMATSHPSLLAASVYVTTAQEVSNLYTDFEATDTSCIFSTDTNGFAEINHHVVHSGLSTSNFKEGFTAYGWMMLSISFFR